MRAYIWQSDADVWGVAVGGKDPEPDIVVPRQAEGHGIIPGNGALLNLNALSCLHNADPLKKVADAAANGHTRTSACSS